MFFWNQYCYKDPHSEASNFGTAKVRHGNRSNGMDKEWTCVVQVFKFPPYGGGDGKPLITLGTRFEPGADDRSAPYEIDLDTFDPAIFLPLDPGRNCFQRIRIIPESDITV